MGKAIKEFEHESLLNKRSVVAYLAALQEGFSNGTLTLSDPHGKIEMHPQGLIRLGILAMRKRERVRLVLRFEWKGNGSANGRPWPLTVRAGRGADGGGDAG